MWASGEAAVTDAEEFICNAALANEPTPGSMRKRNYKDLCEKRCEKMVDK